MGCVVHTDIQNQAGYLLWVGDTSGSSAFQIAEEYLDSETFCQVEDVYCALVRIVRCYDIQPCVVIINVDRLHPSEMALFDIFQKYFGKVIVYTWSVDASSPRLLDAGVRGAKKIGNNESLNEILTLVSGTKNDLSYSPPDAIERELMQSDMTSMDFQMNSHCQDQEECEFQIQSSDEELEIDEDLEERLLAGLEPDSSQLEEMEDSPENIDHMNPAPHTERRPPSSSSPSIRSEDPLTYYSDQVSTYLPPVPDYSKPLSYLDNAVVESTPSARVPWKRYADTPRRKPPSDTGGWSSAPQDDTVEEQSDSMVHDSDPGTVDGGTSEDTLIPLVPEIECSDEDLLSFDDNSERDRRSVPGMFSSSHSLEQDEKKVEDSSSYDELPLLTVEELEALFGREGSSSDQQEEDSP